MSYAAGQSTDRFESLTMPQLLLQFLTPNLGYLLFLDLRLKPMIHAHQFTAHTLQIRCQIMQLANAGIDVERLRIVSRGNGSGDIPQPVDGARQAIAQDDGYTDRHGQIARQKP